MSSQKVARGRARDGEPLLTVAARNVGLTKAFKVLGYMAAWDVAQKALGPDMGIEAYVEWWKEPRATAYRHQVLFREAFPGETTPARLLAEVQGQWDDRRGLSGLGEVLIPA